MSDPVVWPPFAGSGALQGMRVLDLSQQLPGPYSTFLLATLGASVIKVEPPGGDLGKVVDPSMYAGLNGHKTVVELDLKTDDGRRTLHALAGQADVVVEASRPGVAARLGADPATLAAVNPQLVYCSISGFGQSGPLADRPAHDLNVQAIAGAVPTTQRRQEVGVAWVDLATGSAAALAIAAAWHAGQFGFIDLAMLDLAASWTAVKPHALTDVEPAYGLISSGDGHQFVIAVLEDKVWLRLCSTLGWDDWCTDEGLGTPDGRRAAAALIRERLEKTFADLDGPGVARLARLGDLPITAVAPADPHAGEQLALRGFDQQARGPIPSPAPWPTPLTGS